MSRFKYSVGPWNVHEGADAYGPATRDTIPFEEKIKTFKEMGFDAIQFHDDDAVPNMNNMTETEIVEEAKKLNGGEIEPVDVNSLITDFWNSNENLFKVVLYNHCKNFPDKLASVNRVIKTNNRDSARYLVGLGDGQWLNTNGRPASKSETSYLIFKAYCEKWASENHGQTLTLDALREAFPGKINEYYYNRYLRHLFYDIDDTPCIDVETSKHYGNPLDVENSWDFYNDDKHAFPNVQDSKIRSVKMWRKGDFDRLIEYVKKHYKFIVIEEC